MRKKESRNFNYSNWKTKSESSGYIDLIEKIASGKNEYREKFFENAMDIVIYAVDFFATINELKQQDIDDLMVVGIFGVNKAINYVSQFYLKGNELHEYNIRKYILLNVIRALEVDFKQKNRRIEAESYELMSQKIEDGNLIADSGLLDTGDFEYFARIEQLKYLRKAIKVSLKEMPKDELEFFFKVYPIEQENELDMVRDFVNEKMSIRAIGEKYGYDENDSLRIVTKMLGKIRRTVSRIPSMHRNPLKY